MVTNQQAADAGAAINIPSDNIGFDQFQNSRIEQPEEAKEDFKLLFPHLKAYYGSEIARLKIKNN